MSTENQSNPLVPKTSPPAPTLSAQVEGQTDEGLWTAIDRGFKCNVVDICKEDGGLVAAGVDKLAAENIIAAHNADITKRQQPSHTDEEIAREAAVELRYRRNLGPLTPYTDIELATKVILAALRAKSEKKKQETNQALDLDLRQLAHICTCKRPTKLLPGGGVEAPGDHTANCVSVIAVHALSLLSPALKPYASSKE